MPEHLGNDALRPAGPPEAQGLFLCRVSLPEQALERALRLVRGGPGRDPEPRGLRLREVRVVRPRARRRVARARALDARIHELPWLLLLVDASPARGRLDRDGSDHAW